MVQRKQPRSFGEKFGAKFPSHMGFWTGLHALGNTGLIYTGLRNQGFDATPGTAAAAAGSTLVLLPAIAIDGAMRGAATAAISSAISNQRRRRSKRRSRRSRRSRRRSRR